MGMLFAETVEKARELGYVWDDRFVMFYHKDSSGPAWEVAVSVEQMENIIKDKNAEQSEGGFDGND